MAGAKLKPFEKFEIKKRLSTQDLDFISDSGSSAARILFKDPKQSWSKLSITPPGNTSIFRYMRMLMTPGTVDSITFEYGEAGDAYDTGLSAQQVLAKGNSLYNDIDAWYKRHGNSSAGPPSARIVFASIRLRGVKARPFLEPVSREGAESFVAAYSGVLERRLVEYFDDQLGIL